MCSCFGKGARIAILAQYCVYAWRQVSGKHIGNSGDNGNTTQCAHWEILDSTLGPGQLSGMGHAEYSQWYHT